MIDASDLCVPLRALHLYPALSVLRRERPVFQRMGVEPRGLKERLRPERGAGGKPAKRAAE